MKANTLLKDLLGPDLRVHASKDLNWENFEINSVVDDSRQTSKDSMFFAIRGSVSDGHDFLNDVAKRQPAAICVEDISRVPQEYEGLIVEAENVRKVFAKLTYKLAEGPADNWWNIGVTGTNGKTTVTYMIEHILKAQNIPVGVIGTVDHHLGTNQWPTQLTTPGAKQLTLRLQEFARLGAKALAIEASSHALFQNRVDGIPFNVAIFTNLSRDHLDFHNNLEDYFQSKLRLFTELVPESRAPKGAVINGDDTYGKKLARLLKYPVLTFGAKDCDLNYEILEEDFSGTKIKLTMGEEEEILRLSVPCVHNIQNALAAVGATLLLGIKKEDALLAISQFTGVKGRLEAVKNTRGLHIFVDYAHTDDALHSVLKSLSEIRTRNRLTTRILTVFGCGGDRDVGKRPMMFEAASRFSDYVVVTSDNPRTEDPNAILDDILKNVKNDDVGKRVIREVDRKKAIILAIQHAKPGDVVLIAGKGHEEYQIMGKQKNHFSDREVVEEALL